MKLIESDYSDQVFKKADFLGDDFSAKKFCDCIFDGCNLSLVKIEDASLQNVRFEHCKLVGLDFSKLNIFNLELGFKDCVLSNCIFTGLQLDGISFERSVISDCFFADTSLKKANFCEADLSGTTFEKADLTGASFVGAKNYAINPLGNKIAKAKFSYPEALRLLKYFDIEIEL